MAPNEAAKVIRQFRMAQLWTVRRLARETGLSAGYISQLETGARPATARALAKIADAVHMPRYYFLVEGGFIPEAHRKEAEQMARRAMDLPSIAMKARGKGKRQKIEWLTADYLYLLGDDAYGTGYSGGPGGQALDWTELVPDAPAPMLERLRPEIDAWLATNTPPRPLSPIEGWDDLSDADRAFVQQMVNKLRRSTSGEQ